MNFGDENGRTCIMRHENDQEGDDRQEAVGLER